MSKTVDIIIQAQDNASAKLRAVGSSLSDIGRQALGFGLAQIGITALSTALEKATTALIGYNAKMQQTAIGFETMLGSAEAAQTFIAQLSDFAARTPFEFPQVQEAAKKFLAFGWAAKDVIPTLEAVGNAAAGLGIGAEGIERITLAIGQMKAKGRVQGDELLQLAEAGIPAYQILAEKLGLTGDQIAKIGDQAIDADTAIKALVEGMNERFPDMMKRQSDTFLGMLSTIKDNAATIFGSLGEPLFNSLTGPLKSIRDFTNKVVDELRQGGLQVVFENLIPPEWQARIEKAFNMFARLAETVEPNMNAVGKIVSEAMEVVGTAFDAVAPAIDLFINTIVTVSKVVSDVFIAATEFATEMREELRQGFTEIWQDAVNIFGNVYDAIVGVFQAVGDALGQVWEAIKSSIWDSVVEFVRGILERLGPLGTLIEKVGKSLANAWNSFWNSSGSSTSSGSKFRDFLGSLNGPAKVTPEGLDALNRHRGTKPLEFGDDNKAADKLANKIDNMYEKIADAFDKMNQRIIEETGTTYQLGMAKIQDELDKMNRELVEDAAALGIDTSALQAKMEEYAQVMTEPVKRAWREAWTDIKNQTALVTAQLTGDKKAQAEAEYNIALAALEKERRERLKAIAVDQTDKEAQAAVDKWYEQQKALALQERLKKEREAKIEAFDQEIETNQLMVDLHVKTQDEVNKLNREVLDKKISFLEEELKKEGLTAEEILRIRKELANAQTQKEAMPQNFKEAITGGLREAQKSFGDFWGNVQKATQEAATAMRDTMSDFFFDAMTGKLKSLGDYFSNFFKAIARQIANLMANAWATQILSSIGIKLPGKAVGGPVNYGQAYIVGERGPELFIPQSAGRIVPNSELAVSNRAPTVIVNVINNTGQPVQAQQAEPKFDGQRYIVDVFLDAYARNVGGIRTVLGGTR